MKEIGPEAGGGGVSGVPGALFDPPNRNDTRMHSSRMRTVRCSGRRGGGVQGRGGVSVRVCPG